MKMLTLKWLVQVLSLPLVKKTGMVVKPRFLNFLITYHCNSRCTMCGIWRRNHKEKELSAKEILGFFEQNKYFFSDLCHIGITGGEPVTRSDLVGIIKGIKKILPNVELGFQTNGLLPEKTEKILRQIISFYPGISLAVSLDGLRKTHDSIRGIKGAFEKSLTTVKLAKALGIKRITSGMTINEKNFLEVEAVKQLVEDLGCEFTCFLPDKADYFNNEQYDFTFVCRIKDKLAPLLEKNFSHHYFVDNLRLQLENKRVRRLLCYSGYTSLVLDPYGNIKPCILRPETFGNLRQKPSLEKMLFNPKALLLKNRLKSCSCWNQCEVSTSAVVSPWDVLWWFIFYCQKKREFLVNFYSRLTSTDSL